MTVFVLFRDNPEGTGRGCRQFLGVYASLPAAQAAERRFVEEYGDFDNYDYEIIETTIEGVEGAR